jgi:hypothetical protein
MRKLLIGVVAILLGAGISFALLFHSPAPPKTPLAFVAPPPVEQGFHAVNVTTRQINSDIVSFRTWMDQGQMVKALRSTDAIAKPAQIDYLSGTWPAVGAVRRVRLEDGHYVLEQVLVNEFPGVFRYQVWGFTNAAGNLVKYAVGEFRYVALAADKTQFTWTYRMRPRSALLRPIINNFVANRFAPFMEGGMQGVAAGAPQLRSDQSLKM